MTPLLAETWDLNRSVPLLEASQVHAWHLNIHAAAPEAWPLLSGDERARAERFRFDRDRASFVACRAKLRLLLGQYLGQTPESIRFDYGAFGKPSVTSEAGGAGIRFSVSHSGGWALIAMSRDREVSADLEQIRGDIDILQLSSRFFSAREAEFVRGSEPQAQIAAFLTCWTRKEALMKGVGSGLSEPLDRFDVSASLGRSCANIETADGVRPRWTIHDIPLNGAVAAVAIEGESPCGLRLLRDT